MKNDICFIFPGQGSQYLNMLSQYYSDSIFQETFATASEVLAIDLLQLIQQEDVALLNKTANTQPLLLTASVALYKMWQQYQKTEPKIMAGHSLGEYSALTCAQVISFEDAVKIVRFRGELMQAAVPEGIGAMAAILGLTDEKLQSFCEQTNLELAGEKQIVEAVNFNSPGQVVVAGHKKAVMHLIDILKANGVKRAILLPVSVPSHSTLMYEASHQLATRLEETKFHSSNISIVQNVSAKPTNCKETLKTNLVKQLYSPVFWSDSIKHINNMNINHFVECGPGNVLTGLNKRILDSSSKSFALDNKVSTWHMQELTSDFL